MKQQLIGRRGVLAGASGLLASPAIVHAQGQNGVALVIGNSKYHWEASLPNVRRDAPDIAKRFQALGLKTELVQDAGRDTMRAAIEKFRATANGANLAAFYFAGHGASWEQDTYLVPVDSDLGAPSVVKTLVPVPSVGTAMQGAAHRFLVFDNCRNNPADGWRQLAAERAARVNPDKQRATGSDGDANSLTLYSTAPGRVAVDGPAGENSPFAAALLRQLAATSIDLQTLAPRLRRDLLIATEGRQVLWDQNTYQQTFPIASGGSSAQSGGAGWSGDPARIIEIRRAYDFARENRLPLPEGLIAHRPAANSPHASKVGAFSFTNLTPIGPSPFLFIVMSVDEQASAQLIIAGQNNEGRFWRFVTGSVSGNRLTYVPDSGALTYLIDWRSDANSGSVSTLQSDNGTGPGRVRNISFKRLDG